VLPESAPISTDLLQETLLALNQIATGITVLALNASMQPDQVPRIRALLENLLALIRACEGEVATDAASPLVP
jgi:hypothetical protein